MTDKNDDVSAGGSHILRHDAAAERHDGVAPMDGEALEAIDQHLCEFIGEPAHVFHEVVSDLVHIDVHIVAPSADRPCYTLVTTGMSDAAMTVPEGAEAFRHAELLLSLPETWTPGPLWEANLHDETVYWPIKLLKSLARFPHTYGTWLGPGHTVPNGDPPAPFASNTQLCCAMVMPTMTLPVEFSELAVRPEKTINFYAVVPLHLSEMHFKLQKGSEALMAALEASSVTEIIDPGRPVAASRKRFLFF